ncbi:ABC transporter permease [Fredinandcohnia humi]
MKSLQIAWKDFLIQFRDRKAFLLMILMPLLLTAILGTALKDVFGSDSSFARIKVGVYQIDQDPLTTTFVNEVLKGKDLQNAIEVIEIDSESQLEKFVRNEKVDAGIIFPEKWSKGIQAEELVEAIVLTDSNKEIAGTVVESMITSYTERVSAVYSSTHHVVSKLAMAQPVSTGTIDVDKIGRELASELQKQAVDPTTEIVRSDSVGEKQVSSMQYYAAAMAVMFLLFNMTLGAKSIIKERSIETFARLLSTPTGKQSILFGKFLGVFCFAVLQFFLFVGVTHFVSKVYWGDNLVQLFVIGISYSIAVSGLSMLFASILKTEKTADTVGGMVVQMLALLGGSMLPIAIFPDTLKNIASIVPNNWALTSLLEIMQGTTWTSLLPAVGVLLGIGMISVVIGSFRLKVQ